MYSKSFPFTAKQKKKVKNAYGKNLGVRLKLWPRQECARGFFYVDTHEKAKKIFKAFENDKSIIIDLTPEEVEYNVKWGATDKPETEKEREERQKSLKQAQAKIRKAKKKGVEERRKEREERQRKAELMTPEEIREIRNWQRREEYRERREMEKRRKLREEEELKARPIPVPRTLKPTPAPRTFKPIPAPRTFKPIPAPRKKQHSKVLAEYLEALDKYTERKKITPFFRKLTLEDIEDIIKIRLLDANEKAKHGRLLKNYYKTKGKTLEEIKEETKRESEFLDRLKKKHKEQEKRKSEEEDKRLRKMLLGYGLFLSKNGKTVRIETDGEGLYLSPVPNMFKGSGMFLVQNGQVQKGRGFLSHIPLIDPLLKMII